MICGGLDLSCDILLNINHVEAFLDRPGKQPSHGDLERYKDIRTKHRKIRYLDHLSHIVLQFGSMHTRKLHRGEFRAVSCRVRMSYLSM